MINIEDLIPFMKKGWVAMEEDGEWIWYSTKPVKRDCCWDRIPLTRKRSLEDMFDIAPAEDWEKSLRKVE